MNGIRYTKLTLGVDDQIRCQQMHINSLAKEDEDNGSN